MASVRSRQALKDDDMSDPTSDPSFQTDVNMDSTTDMEDLAGSPPGGEIRIGRKSFNKAVLVTHINIFLYSCCFWIQQAVFPVSFSHFVVF